MILRAISCFFNFDSTFECLNLKLHFGENEYRMSHSGFRVKRSRPGLVIYDSKKRRGGLRSFGQGLIVSVTPCRNFYLRVGQRQVSLQDGVNSDADIVVVATRLCANCSAVNARSNRLPECADERLVCQLYIVVPCCHWRDLASKCDRN